MGENVVVDEIMVLFRGLYPFNSRYIPGASYKYGVRLTSCVIRQVTHKAYASCVHGKWDGQPRVAL